jgi:proteasome lid subunit RPN8/RPN11
MLCLPYACQRMMLKSVEEAYPEEGCGILLGRRGQTADEVTHVLACANVDDEPRRRYAIAPEELVAAQRQAREQGLEILGFYHSHPDRPAKPSETDLRRAHWSGCVYLICEVRQGKLAGMSAVRLGTSQRWLEEQISLEPEDGAKAATI